MYKIKNRIWIETEDGTFLGEGRIELLEKIQEFGSISKASKSMSMSYSKALKLVNSMNELGSTPLVNQSVGGSGGGGTKVTDAGLEAIRIFKEIDTKTNQFLNQELNKVKL